VALLRGINVGRNKRIAMSDLRDVAEGLGWSQVTTLLATGNLIFTPQPAEARADTAKLAAKLEKALADRHRLASRVVVLSIDDVETVLKEQPFGARADNPSRLLVAAYLDGTVRKKLEVLVSQDWAPGALALGRHAAYLWCPDGILESALLAAVTRATGDGLTARNWSTWQKIHRLAAATSKPAPGQRSRIDLSAG
jgi:uncharacterized protein (DUF1697 family)